MVRIVSVVWVHKLSKRLVLALAVAVFMASGCGATEERSAGSSSTVADSKPSEGSSVDPSVVTFRPVLSEGDSTLELTPVADQSPDREVVLAARSEPGFAEVRYRLGPVLVDAASIESASVGSVVDQESFVSLVFREGDPGIDRFNAAAAACYAGTPTCPALPGRENGALAIISGGVVVSAPSTNEPEYERDQIQISGVFTEAEAVALVASLTK